MFLPGFIPNEDQGMIYAIIQTPPGSSLERTNNTAGTTSKMTEDMDDVKSVSALVATKFLQKVQVLTLVLALST